MRTYTETEVKGIIDENLKHLAEIAKLKEQLSKETQRREFAEKKYSYLCERCMSFYLTRRDADDTIYVQVTAPRFMQREDFTKGLVQRIVSACNAERDKTIFHDIHTDRYKPKTD